MQGATVRWELHIVSAYAARDEVYNMVSNPRIYHWLLQQYRLKSVKLDDSHFFHVLRAREPGYRDGGGHRAAIDVAGMSFMRLSPPRV